MSPHTDTPGCVAVGSWGRPLRLVNLEHLEFAREFARVSLAADVLQNKLTRAQYLDEVTWTTKSWLGLQKQRISVVLHTAIAEQVVNELACGGGGRVHGAKCLATLAGVA